MDSSERDIAICTTCPRECKLSPGQTGVCHARRNVGGHVVPVGYGQLTSIAMDPVEKKPLAMWQPGTYVLSVGSFGCNLRCPFCQNHSIACAREGELPVRETEPQELVDAALQSRSRGCVGLAFTYNEPLVSWEFVRDTSLLAHEAGLASVVVTNGMVSDAVLNELLPLMDAVNVDLKGFSPEFYAMCCTGQAYGECTESALELGQRAFDAVRNFISRAAATPTCHVEVTTLVVPQGESVENLERAAQWLASVDPNIPYHVTQYHPAHKWLGVPPLPNRQVRAVANTARRHLNHVFTGNM